LLSSIHLASVRSKDQLPIQFPSSFLRWPQNDTEFVQNQKTKNKKHYNNQKQIQQTNRKPKRKMQNTIQYKYKIQKQKIYIELDGKIRHFWHTQKEISIVLIITKEQSVKK
jgi:hypothetical protein